MINSAAKYLFGLALATLVIAVGVAALVRDPGAFAFLVGIAACLAITGVVLTGAGLEDRAPVYFSPHDAPPVQLVSAGPSRAPAPSPWPFVAAVAGGFIGLGLAISSGLVIVGVVIGVLTIAGWMSQAWREDPSFTPRQGAVVSGRLLTPVGLPVMALALIAVIVISISRILLTLPRAGSIIVAFLLALALLVAFFALSSRPHLTRNSLIVAAGFSVVILVAAGSVSAANGYRTFEHAPPAGPIVEVAQNTAFKLKTIIVTQGELVRISFDNRDRGVYHNVAVYDGTTPLWAGQPIDGVRKITYQNTFDLAPGTYTFRCNFHPTSMVGTFIVKPSSTSSTTP